MLPVARREARERAIALLYEAEVKQLAVTEVLAGLPVPPDGFTEMLVSGVGDHQVAIDEIVARHAIGWALDRMPAMDRAVLRLATFELLDLHDVPTAVVLSEAVELAGAYSTDESGRFVNGVLSSVASELRPQSGHPT